MRSTAAFLLAVFAAACATAPSEEVPGDADQGSVAEDLGPVAEPDLDPPPPMTPEVPLPPCIRTVAVSTSAELKAANGKAQAGDCIVLADGDYAFDAITRQGTVAKPIVVQAAHLGKATVSTGSIEVRGGAYVVLQGLSFSSGNGAIRLIDCDHCRLTRSWVRPQEVADNIDWINVSGKSDYCRIDHNDVGPRTRIGNDVMLAGDGTQVVQHTRIDHNFFHDVHRTTGNGWETIRAGLSQWTFSSANTMIESNLFKGCDGDPETISIKSSDNVLRYNTLRANQGELTLRHGNRSLVYGNFIFADGVADAGGIRVLGGEHRIYNNYLSEVSIFLEGGESNDQTGMLTDHKQVYRAQVVFNTVIANRGISVGGAHPLQPIDCTIANNLLQGMGPLVTETAGSQNTRYVGNIANGNPGLKKTPGELEQVDPMLVKMGDLLKLSAGSAAIDAADPSFTFVTDDIDGDPRGVAPDIGADEYAQQAPVRGPLTEADVGPAAP
jgi:poly(beta-D-mannuronate) lyase